MKVRFFDVSVLLEYNPWCMFCYISFVNRAPWRKSAQSSRLQPRPGTDYFITDFIFTRLCSCALGGHLSCFSSQNFANILMKNSLFNCFFWQKTGKADKHCDCKSAEFCPHCLQKSVKICSWNQLLMKLRTLFSIFICTFLYG